MTKEEIIAPKFISLEPDIKHAIKECMHEYAKQQVMAFHIFTENECWKYNSLNDTWHQFNYDAEPVSYDLVYDQFIEQQNSKISKKVKCINVDNYGNDQFDGPDTKLGDIVTVLWEGDFMGIHSYSFVEFGPDFLYSAWRYEEVKKGDN